MSKNEQLGGAEGKAAPPPPDGAGSLIQDSISGPWGPGIMT